MIQIYMLKKNFDVQKAERWFKERKIPFQTVDLNKKGPAKREAELFLSRLGNPGVFNEKSELYLGHIVRFTSDRDTLIEKIMAEPALLNLPIVRSGNQVAAGYRPDLWETFAK